MRVGKFFQVELGKNFIIEFTNAAFSRVSIDLYWYVAIEPPKPSDSGGVRILQFLQYGQTLAPRMNNLPSRWDEDLSGPAKTRCSMLARVARFVLFNKPFGVVCQFSPSPGKLTLKDFIPVEDVYPAGRLDHDSEGLVLLTDDGAAQHQLTDPRFGHPRTYWVQVEREPGPEALAALSSGVTIPGYPNKSARVLRIDEPVLPPRFPPVRFRKTVPTAWLEMTLTEGKNRQVRHMTAAAGHPTLRLVRAAIGNLRLDGLEPGDWRWLTDEEATALTTSSAGGSRRPDSSNRRPHSRNSGSRRESRPRRRL